VDSIPWNTPGWRLQLASVCLQIILWLRNGNRGSEGWRTSLLVGGPWRSSSVEALIESIQFQQSFPSSSLFECGSSVGILWIPTGSRLSSPSGVLGFWLVRIPTTLPQSGWFTNYSKSFIRFSYVICAFTYRIVELVFILSYIRSGVWGSNEYSGRRCGDYYLIPQRLPALMSGRS
jgi:hypothetical protein